jgi:uncharacterized protein DUF3298/peptidoglycan-N-acetylmuramic acid deacetylase PdaC-like protein
MRHILYLLLFLPFVVLSCKEQNETKEKTEDQQPIREKDWYKRYTGTVAGEPVTVNLYHSGKDVKGTYCYDKKGIILDLNSEADSSKGDNYFLYEGVSTEHTDDNDYHNNAHWSVVIGGNTVSGKWVSQNGRKSFDINLKEDYSNGACKFYMLFHGDSVALQTKSGRIGATSIHRLSLPADDEKKENKDFLNATLLHIAGSSGTSAKNINEAIYQADTAFFGDYKTNTDTSDVDSNDLMSYNYEAQENVSVIYNEYGIVVFEVLGYSFTGGAHGNYGMSFVCADVQEKKTWELKDIMNVDTPKLSTLLDKEARRVYKIPDGGALTGLQVDTIPVTSNVYFTHTGMVFSYTPYEIASYADGQISFFIPFTILTDMLTPAFKKRMNL